MKNNERQLIPVVLVEGFLGRGSPGYWGDLTKHNRPNIYTGTRRRLICPHLGTVSSLHDRACELYYQLKGGTVDYGERHSSAHGHSRFGRTYAGLYPEWNAERPLHFLGHSYGGVTVWYLQQLLIKGYFREDGEEFDDMDDNADFLPTATTGSMDGGGDGAWIRSLTGISAPFCGTTATYILGEREDIPAKVRPLSVGSFIYRTVHLYLYCDFGPYIRSKLYDFNVDHWGFGRTRAADSIRKESPFRTLLKNLKCSEWAERRDCAPYDLTARRMALVNRRASLCSTTYYQSFSASMTKKNQKTGFHDPIVHPLLPLSALAYFVGRHQFESSKLRDEISGISDGSIKNENEPCHEQCDEKMGTERKIPDMGHYCPSDWWDNDGVVSTISQRHPGACRQDYCNCAHSPALIASSSSRPPHQQAIQPGVWQTYRLDDTSHVDIVPDVVGMLLSTSAVNGPEDIATIESSRTTLWTKAVRYISSLVGTSESHTEKRDVANSRHAEVFEHYFQWLNEIDEPVSQSMGNATPVNVKDSAASMENSNLKWPSVPWNKLMHCRLK